MTTERLPLRIDSTGGSTVRTSVLNSSSSSRDAFRVDIGHRHHRRLVTAADHAPAARYQRPGRAAELQHRQDLGVAGALGAQRVARDTCPASVRPSRPAARRTDPAPAGRVRGWRRSGRAGCPGAEIAAVISCLVGGSGSSAASARTHCMGSKPIGRTTTSSRATGSSRSSASATIWLQFGLDAGRADEFFEVLQPRRALAAERDGIGLTGVQPIDERVHGLDGLPDARWLIRWTPGAAR